MLRDVLSNTGPSIWPIISLLIMLVAFTAVLVWTYAGRKNRFENESNLPLELDDEQEQDMKSTRGLSS
ncbi:MAG: CcoQ/FixQ family Cbb3-type cytochrome c oxidase assembly chaperone [bacterium]|nr:CcoQ/FixQ family Cbb3-type cytochrome c oxidase assembly chaperone [bacterium]MBK8128266.1 CcoQ/FixQ family Cbb3-type cytochrome c oxidase assembly chaperone [bacterium]